MHSLRVDSAEKLELLLVVIPQLGTDVVVVVVCEKLQVAKCSLAQLCSLVENDVAAVVVVVVVGSGHC